MRKEAPEAVKGVLDLREWNFERDGPAQLRGEWEFWWDTIISPQALQENEIPAGRRFVSVPGAWQRIRSDMKYPPHGLGTYRLRLKNVDVSSDILAAVVHQSVSAYTLHINGKPIIIEGVIGNDYANHIPVVNHGIGSLAADSPDIELVLHMGSPPHPCLGLGFVEIGLPWELYHARKACAVLISLIIGCIVIMAIYHGIAFFLQRQDTATLYFFLSCLFIAASMTISFYENIWLTFFPGSNYWTYGRLSFAFGNATIISLGLFARALFPREFPRKVIILAVISICCVSIPLALPNKYMLNYLFVYLNDSVTTIAALYSVVALILAAVRKKDGAIIFLLGYGAVAICAIIDTSMGYIGVTVTAYGHLGALALLICQATVLARRSARNRKEIFLKQQQLAHAEKLAAMGTLVGSVAHEINNPNNAIMLGATTLERTWRGVMPVLDEYAGEHGDFSVGGMSYAELKQEIPEALRRTTRNSERIKRIVEDLRRFSRKDEGSYNEHVDINGVVRGAIGVMEHTLRKSTANLQISLSQDIPTIKGNAQRLEQVIINLLNNARQALPSPDRGIFIATAFDKTEAVVTITVRDQGRGMDKKTLEQIEQPFFTTKGEGEGTGLGLSICRRIVKKHGGQIVIESNKGDGTTVTIHIAAENRS